MRSVRCDACGTRALLAASKCPKCAHEIEVRDGFGEMLPLAHCSSCDSFYPERLGSCRWCGTKPERAPVGPFVWKGVGIATFVAMAWGAWLVHDDPPAEVSQARLAAVLKPDTSAGSLDSSLAAAAVVDSAGIDSLAQDDSTDVVASDSTISSVATVVAALSDSIPEPAAVSGVASDSMPVVAEPVAQTEPTPSEPVRSRDPGPTREPTVTREPVMDRRAVATREPAANGETPPVATRAVTPPAAPRTIASAPERSGESAAERAPTVARPSGRSTAATRPSSRVTSAAKAPAKSVAKAPAKTTVAKGTTPKSTAKSSTKTTVAKAPTKPRATRAVWVNSVARNWTVVRAGADRGSRVIASIGPNTRVQLGEARGGWRRIRAKGLAGWVEQRSFFAGVGTSRKTGSLAAR